LPENLFLAIEINLNSVFTTLLYKHVSSKTKGTRVNLEETKYSNLIPQT